MRRFNFPLEVLDAIRHDRYRHPHPRGHHPARQTSLSRHHGQGHKHS